MEVALLDERALLQPIITCTDKYINHTEQQDIRVDSLRLEIQSKAKGKYT